MSAPSMPPGHGDRTTPSPASPGAAAPSPARARASSTSDLSITALVARTTSVDLATTALVALAASLAAHFAAGSLSLGMWDVRRLVVVGVFPLLFVLSVLLVVVVASLVRLKHFVDAPTGKVAPGALLASVWVNPLPGGLLALAVGYGITGCGNLVELYRAHTTRFHDATLWAIEAPLFQHLLASPLNVPVVWDRIYFSFWAFLFVVIAVLYHEGRREFVARFMLATVLAFYLTRVIALAYPTAGPAFVHPESFALDDTTSAATQEMLRRYMRGEIAQNGILPGTTAMPSLHVGLVALAVALLGRAHPRTFRWSVPWLALTWASTVFLGWHYALDGLAGMALAALAFVLASGALRLGRAVHDARSRFQEREPS